MFKKCVLFYLLSVKGGLTTSVLQKTAINELMIRRCQGHCYVLAAASKIGREHNFLSGSIEQISAIITSKGADTEELSRLRNRNIEIVELTTE